MGQATIRVRRLKQNVIKTVFKKRDQFECQKCVKSLTGVPFVNYIYFFLYRIPGSRYFLNIIGFVEQKSLQSQVICMQRFKNTLKLAFFSLIFPEMPP